jgi:hypothetical protein
MKYRQLTTEQLNEMHEEFALFLASQKIDASKWEEIKDTKPEVVEEEINLFSDLVWEKVLSNTSYINHFDNQNLNLFRCDAENIQRILIKCEKKGFNFSNPKDYKWFIENSKDKSITYFKGQKTYFKERNIEIFEMVEKGCVISKGDLYEMIFKII